MVVNPHLSIHDKCYGFTSCSRTSKTPSIVPEFLRSTSCKVTSARGHGAIVYCLNSGSGDRQTGRHNVLCEGDTRNRWRDGQVCPDVGQGTMEPWARRLGTKRDGRERERRGERTEKERGRVGDGKREERSRGERDRGARLVWRKGLSPEIGVKKTMNAGGVENRID
ncbi:hypothetical protein TNCV_1286051 [Trichonephila clavipes]|uniref:Uncharacterized protein n=1 Tax=Trichonephila clavipes TaxID=2585209 RepID=A0A8X6SR93_TRICX|nr:hypothetical protein TNCV_1286051 [Trichonephila clavipes]